MNLVLSGPIDDSLRNLVVALSTPRRVVRLHANADRLEGATDDAATRQQVAALCEAARVDHAYIEEGVRFADFKLLAMDMDSTLITIECIDEIADYAGKKTEVAAITEAAMRGEMDFEESLRRRVALLKDLPNAILMKVYETRVKMTAGAVELINAARKNKIHTLLLSGGFNFFTERLRENLQLDEAYGNTLEIVNDKITGRLVGPIIDAKAKAKLVQLAMSSLHTENCIAVGDGANDIPMMAVASHSVAFYAKPTVCRAATYSVKYRDLTVILDYFDQQIL